MASYMQMIYIDSDENARHTNVRARMETNAKTWAAFNSYRYLDVGTGKAEFLLDYHNRRGDLAGTIGLSKRSFELISNEKAKSDGAYRKIDDEYWDKARAEMKP